MALFGKNYNDVQVGGEFKPLPSGGYICRILSAKMSKNSNDLPMIEVAIDISDGEYAQYFHKLYRDRIGRDPNAKYPYNGVLRITAVDEEGNTKKNFKSFVTSVEKSNDCELPRHDEAFLKALKDKTVGVLYQREEYEGNDGKTHWSTKPKWFRDVETIESGNFTVPEDVPLSDTYGTGFESVDTFSAQEDSIPF